MIDIDLEQDEIFEIVKNGLFKEFKVKKTPETEKMVEFLLEIISEAEIRFSEDGKVKTESSFTRVIDEIDFETYKERYIKDNYNV